MNNYKVTIKETSRGLTPRERVKIKDTSEAIKLDEATKSGEVIITPDFYAILNIHNEKANPQDYENYLIVDKSGTRYITGSPSFWDAFTEIADELTEIGDTEDFQIKVYKMDSKNYKGKQFLTCSLV